MPPLQYCGILLDLDLDQHDLYNVCKSLKCVLDSFPSVTQNCSAPYENQVSAKGLPLWTMLELGRPFEARQPKVLHFPLAVIMAATKAACIGALKKWILDSNDL